MEAIYPKTKIIIFKKLLLLILSNIILALTPCLATEGLSKSYAMTALNVTPVVFETVDRARFYKDSWIFFTQFNIMDLSAVIFLMDQYEQKTEQICSLTDDMEYRQTCNLITRETKILINTLKTNNQHLLKLSKPHLRSKRALNAVGRFAHWAFGSMDDEDAAKIYNQLMVLQIKESQTFNMHNRQATVMSANFKKMTQPIGNLTTEMEDVERHLRALEVGFNNLTAESSKELGLLKVRVKAYELITYINSKLMEVESRQTLEINILDDLFNGKLHPLILGTTDLAIELRNIGFTRTPFMENNYILHQILHVSVLLEEHNFIIRIEVPLPDDTEYVVRMVHLIPVTLNSQWDLTIQIKKNYIAESVDHLSYVILSHNELNHCKRVTVTTKQTILVCSINGPILTTGNGHCLVELLQHSANFIRSCKYITVPATAGYLIKMRSPNRWLFTIKTKTILNVNCNGNHSTIPLLNFGILELTRPCDYSTKAERLPYQRSKHTVSEFMHPDVGFQDLIQMLNLTEYHNSTSKVEALSPIKVGNHIEVRTSIIDIGRSLQELNSDWIRANESRQLAEHNRVMTIHSYSIYSITTLATICAAIILSWVILRMKRKTPSRNNINIQLSPTGPAPSIDVPRPPLATNSLNTPESTVADNSTPYNKNGMTFGRV